MQILLGSDVANLGKSGDVVDVADGYARNYLIPKSLGFSVTEENVRRIETEKRRREEQAKEALKTLRDEAARVEGASCTVAAKAGDEGHLYGSVAAKEIAEALANEGIEIDEDRIDLEEPLKELGVYPVVVRLAPEVEATIKVWVVEE